MSADLMLERRESDRRITMLEARYDGLRDWLENHTEEDRRQFGIIHGELSALSGQCTRLGVTDDAHTDKLDSMDGKLDRLLSRQIADDAVYEDRKQTFWNIPNMIKWLVGTIGGLAALWAILKSTGVF